MDSTGLAGGSENRLKPVNAADQKPSLGAKKFRVRRIGTGERAHLTRDQQKYFCLILPQKLMFRDTVQNRVSTCAHEKKKDRKRLWNFRKSGTKSVLFTLCWQLFAWGVIP